MTRIVQQQVIVNAGGCFRMEAQKRDERPRALRLKEKKTIAKKKAHKLKMRKMDSSIEMLRAEVDRLEKAAAAEEAEVARKRAKALELLRAIKEKEDEKEKEDKDKTSVQVIGSKINEMVMG